MAQVSKYQLPRKTEEDLLRSLSLVLASITKDAEMDIFLRSFLTKTERLMLAKRLALFSLLSENTSDAAIARALHLTRITVVKTRYFIDAYGKQAQNIILSRFASDKRLKFLKKMFISLLGYSVRAGGGYVKPTILD